MLLCYRLQMLVEGLALQSQLLVHREQRHCVLLRSFASLLSGYLRLLHGLELLCEPLNKEIVSPVIVWFARKRVHCHAGVDL